MSSPMLIDDSNTAVQYAPGWIWDQLVHDEVDHTRHGAAIPNLTLSLGFTGGGIDVVGTLEPTSRNGQPTTTYAIDGEVIGTYHAPVTTQSTFNVTFFSKHDLSPGNHELVITNINGSSPNLFWLDFFLIYSDPSSQGSSSEISSSTITSSRSSSTSTATAGAAIGGNGASSKGNNVGAIVGGVVGGLIFLALLAILLVLLRRRRHQRPQDVEPFTYANPNTYSHPLQPSTVGSITSAPTTEATSPQMMFNPSALVSRPPALSATGSSGYAPSTHPDPAFGLSTDRGTTEGTLSPNRSPITPASSKLEEAIYGTSASALTAPSSARSDTAPHGGQSPVSPAPSSGPILHEEVSRAPWYAPREGQSRAQSLLRAFSTRQGGSSRSSPSARDVDSGLRLYNEAALPPPYTPD